VVIVTPRELGAFRVRPLPAVVLLHPQLRGPPAVV
jgi:hypothetical protein